MVLEGTQDAQCERRHDDVYVCNIMVRDLLSEDQSPCSTPVVSAVPLDSMPSFSLTLGRKVVAALTDVIMSTDSQVLELHASALFTIGEEELEFMKQLLKSCV